MVSYHYVVILKLKTRTIFILIIEIPVFWRQIDVSISKVLNILLTILEVDLTRLTMDSVGQGMKLEVLCINERDNQFKIYFFMY